MQRTPGRAGRKCQGRDGKALVCIPKPRNLQEKKFGSDDPLAKKVTWATRRFSWGPAGATGRSRAWAGEAPGRGAATRSPVESSGKPGPSLGRRKPQLRPAHLGAWGAGGGHGEPASPSEVHVRLESAHPPRRLGPRGSRKATLDQFANTDLNPRRGGAGGKGREGARAHTQTRAHNLAAQAQGTVWARAVEGGAAGALRVGVHVQIPGIRRLPLSQPPAASPGGRPAIGHQGPDVDTSAAADWAAERSLGSWRRPVTLATEQTGPASHGHQLESCLARDHR